jgi:hypothetical protein
MDLYSWLVLIVMFFIVVGLVYRANKRLARKELEASKDIEDQFHFINEDDHAGGEPEPNKEK